MKKLNTLEKEVVDILLKRLKDEFTAFYFYRSAANWCRNVGFMKAADYFENESKDELEHAKKLEDFMVTWNVSVSLPLIKEPKAEFNSLYEIINNAYDIEYELYENYEQDSVAIFKIGDICTFDLLKFFREVQTKSVGEYSDMINMLEGVNTNSKFEMLTLEKKLF
mgnify:CR=1 FL=1